MQIAAKQGDQASKAKLRIYIMRRIQAEVVIGQKIKHPNIVQFVYCSETGNNIYIFMERCQKYSKSHSAHSKNSSVLTVVSLSSKLCPSLRTLSTQPASFMTRTSLTGTSRLKTSSSKAIEPNWLTSALQKS